MFKVVRWVSKETVHTVVVTTGKAGVSVVFGDSTPLLLPLSDIWLFRLIDKNL